jgi:hypothetical protein
VGGCVEVDCGSHVKLEVGVDGPPVCVNVLGALLVGGGEAVVEARKRHDNVSSDCMHYLLRCLELCSHSTYDLLYVDDMVDDVVGSCINFGVGIMVDIDGELYELAIKLLFPLSHGFNEEGYGEGGIGVGITHNLKLLDNLPPKLMRE